MFAKEVLLLCCLMVLPAVVFGVDCSSSRCLRYLFNSRVISADYYSRPLSSFGSSGSSGKRKRSLSRLHRGIVVTLANTVMGKDRWLIHRGSWGTSQDTVITDADYMSSNWVMDEQTRYLSCDRTVHDFLLAGGLTDRYSLFTHNCIHAASEMWNLANC